jgi:spore germination protein GerM
MGNNRCLLFAVLAVITGCAVVMVFISAGKTAAVSDRSGPAAQDSGVEHTGKIAVQLYFSDRENGFLKSEERVLVHSNDPELLGRNIINALIRGPQEGLAGTIPAGTSLKALYITADGTAYVDMSSEIREAHTGGIESELITIYSMVNSLVLNIPEINAVKILIDGKESLTLTGHVDLRFPFKADMLLIR